MQINKLNMASSVSQLFNTKNIKHTSPLSSDTVSFGIRTRVEKGVDIFEYSNNELRARPYATEYNDENGTIIKHTIYQMGSEKKASVVKYYPNTNIPKEKLYYDLEEEKPIFGFEYDENGKKIAYIDFNYAKKRIFKTIYSPINMSTPIAIESYNIKNNQLIAKRLLKPDGGMAMMFVYDSDSKLKKEVFFHEDGKTASKIICYNDYKVIKTKNFNEKGEEIKTVSP